METPTGVWLTDFKLINGAKCHNVIVKFENGYRCFFNDENWPFEIATSFLILPD